MGVNIDALNSDEDSDYANAVHGFGEQLLARLVRPWLHTDWLYSKTGYGRRMTEHIKVLHDFTEKVISEKEASYDADHSQSSPRKRSALMDSLMELLHNGHISRREVREQIDTFMFEGHDTTATALMYALFCFATNPEHQNKIYEEIVSIIGTDTREALTNQQLSQLPILERCLKESQRLFPSVPMIGRTLEEDLEIEPGKVIPAGMRTMVIFTALHTDPALWPNPHKFDPDRFLPEHISKRHPFAFSPFSAGPRNCIGQKFAMLELKIVMIRILQSFSISCEQNAEDLRPVVSMVLRPEAPVNITFIARDID